MGFWNYIEDFLAGVVDKIVDITNTIWEALKRLWYKIVFLVKKVISFMGDIVSWIRKTVQNLENKIFNFISKLKNKIVKFFVIRFKKDTVNIEELKNAAKGIGTPKPPIKKVDNLFGIDEAEEGFIAFMHDTETDEIEEMNPGLFEKMDDELSELMGDNEIIELQNTK